MQALNIDPVHYLNIYSASCTSSDPGGNTINCGYSWFPTQYSESHYRQGITIDYRCIAGGSYGDDTATHEIGHYFGLYHTFNMIVMLLMMPLKIHQEITLIIYLTVILI